LPVRSIIVDGEAVCIDKGSKSHSPRPFSILQCGVEHANKTEQRDRSRFLYLLFFDRGILKQRSEHERPSAPPAFCRLGLETTEESSACAITACTV
jgi:hypothetical protein